MEKTLYCFIGESGAGKNALVNAIKETYGIPEIISYTARPRRYPEEDGYIFSDEETYQKHKAEGLIFEETEIEAVPGTKYHYWTNNDQYDYTGAKILVCDPDGFHHVHEKLKDTYIVGIHIKTDKATRLERLIAASRKSTEEEKIKESHARMERSKDKFKLIYCNAVVDNNGSLEETLELIKKVMNLE